MTTILPSARSPWHVIDQAIGQQISQNLPGAVQQGYNRGQLQNSLAKIGELAKSGGSPLDVTLAAMQAGAGIPGSEKYLGQIIPMLQQMAAANASQRSPLAGEVAGQQGQTQMRDRSPMESMAQRQALPSFNNPLQQQTEQSFPTNIGPQGGPGQVPQAATTGQKQPLFTRQELIPQAKKLAAERTKEGIPTTAKEALEELNENEESKRQYNKQIDEELKNRIAGQKTYGDRAVEYLKDVDKDAGPEIKTIFQKKGEELAKRGESEADINRALAKEAEKYQAAITNVKSDLDAPRSLNYLQRQANGTYKNFDDAAEDSRKHLRPLIDLGLFNKARSLLQEKGYGIEEREMIIHPLSDQALSLVRQSPDLKPHKFETRLGALAKKPEPDINTIKDTLKNMQQVDSNFSPLLARKAFEDLGYDWRSFKNAWNELLNEGFKPTDDQTQMQGYLDTPPLGRLDQFLQGINVIGR